MNERDLEDANRVVETLVDAWAFGSCPNPAIAAIQAARAANELGRAVAPDIYAACYAAPNDTLEWNRPFLSSNVPSLPLREPPSLTSEVDALRTGFASGEESTQLTHFDYLANNPGSVTVIPYNNCDPGNIPLSHEEDRWNEKPLLSRKQRVRGRKSLAKAKVIDFRLRANTISFLISLPTNDSTAASASTSAPRSNQGPFIKPNPKRRNQYWAEKDHEDIRRRRLPDVPATPIVHRRHNYVDTVVPP